MDYSVFEASYQQYNWNDQARRVRWTGHIIRRVEKRNVYRFSVGKPEGRRLLGSPRCRWEDNIKLDVRKIRWGGMDWIHLAQDREQWWALVGKF
jgi:hypothetical protein